MALGVFVAIVSAFQHSTIPRSENSSFLTLRKSSQQKFMLGWEYQFVTYFLVFPVHMGDYPVSLSSIGAIQKICETFFWSLVGKHQKTRFFNVFWPKTNFLFLLKWSILLLAHLLQSNGRLPCKFDLNRRNTANLRSVFLKSSRKTPENPFFWPKTKFFSDKMATFNVGAPSTIKWAATL